MDTRDFLRSIGLPGRSATTSSSCSFGPKRPTPTPLGMSVTVVGGPPTRRVSSGSPEALAIPTWSSATTASGASLT